MQLKPIIPFEPVRAEKPPEGGSWVAQVKWDGVRMLSYYDGEKVRLVNRNLNDRTRQYPELLAASEYCRADSFILDGEVIAFDDRKPAFSEIMRRDRSKTNVEQAMRRIPITYMVFDILYCDGEWVTQKPLRERQALLERVLIPGKHVQPVGNFPDPSALMAQMRERGMEGIVCKDLDGAYAIGGKDKRWQKLKLYHDLTAVVGGVTYRSGTVNALLLGVYVRGELIYIGHAGTGKLRVADWRDVTERVRPLAMAKRPFANVPERSKDAVWVKPELTVKVQFMEWTPGGTMRQPSIQAFVDVDPQTCTL